MGQLIDGKWSNDDSALTSSKGQFIRKESSFRGKIEKQGAFPPSKNRYHLYISYACPWACRTVMMRLLKGLEQVVSLSSVNVVVKKNGWSFKEDGVVSKDPLYDFKYLHQIYTKADPHYTGRVTVPILWDKESQIIVNNESAEILRILNADFNEFTDQKTDFYPKKFQADIEKINTFILENINNGVYKCGFASNQLAYDQAVSELFKALGVIESLLKKNSYLVGDTFTEADIRLFTTLIRFDMVYVTHFKCNLRQIKDYPHLHRYMLQIYKMPGVSQTVKEDHIKNHYYQSHLHINPTGIVPKGPPQNLFL